MSFKFSWPHQANEVFVTGTFDNWSKSTRLDHVTSTLHEKEVKLPETEQKIFYKFVVDGSWIHDHTGKTETDHEGNVNNVLYPQDITHPTSHSSNLSSVGPGASTTAMAAQQPLQREPSSGLPGSFPETPAATSGEGSQFFSKPEEKSAVSSTIPEASAVGSASNEPSYSAAPTSTGPTSQGSSARGTEETAGLAAQAAAVPAVGAFAQGLSQPSSTTNNTSSLTGNARSTGESYEPSAAKRLSEPSSTSNNTTTAASNARPTEESYQHSASGAPMLPAPLSPQSEREAAGASMFDLGPKTNNMIPESSMGMGRDVPSAIDAGPTISSVAPQSSTNELAGQQPIEPRGVPTVVSDSQEAARAKPEAAANPEAVQDKNNVESELQSKVPEAPATTESGMFGNSENNKGGIAGVVGGGLAATGAAAAGTAYAMRDKYQQSTGTDAASALPKSVTGEPASQQVPQSTGVPPAVTESQEAARADPEASANPEALQEKSQMENELQSKVPEAPSTSESGVFGKSEGGVAGMAAGGLAAAGAAAAGTAYAMRNKVHETTGKDPAAYLPQSMTNEPTSQQSPTSVPAVVSESQQAAHADPEASSNPVALQEKDQMESELQRKVPEAPATATSGTFGKSEGGVAGMAAGGVAAAGAAAAGTAYAMRDKVHETTGTDPASYLPSSMTKEPTSQQSPTSVPAVVSESQQAARADPEASSNPVALQEKDQMESELQNKVPEAPATAESGAFGKSEKGMTGMAAGGVAAAGATAAAGAYAMRDKVHASTGKDPVSALPTSVQESINKMNTTGYGQSAPTSGNAADLDSVPQQTAVGHGLDSPAVTDNARQTTTHVPDEVLTSQKEAHYAPEASAVPEAIKEKSAVEQELLNKVPESQAVGQSAPVAAAALSSTAPSAAPAQSSTGAPQLADPVSGVAPLSMDSKPAQTTTSGLNAGASTPAIPSSTERTLAPEAKSSEPMDSRDISPMTNPGSANPLESAGTQDSSKPTVTTGVGSSTAPTTSTAGAPVGTPRRPDVNTTPSKRGSFIDRMKGTPDSTKSTGSGASGKEKKKGLFGRIKDKLKN